MTHNMAPTTPGSDAEQRAVIATTHIRVISLGDSSVIQLRNHKVISLADPHATHDTGAAQ